MDYKKYAPKKEHPLYGGSDSTAPGGESAGHERPYLGVKFECCSVYTRAYKNADGTAYLARCPKCMRQVTIGINASEGTDVRFFTAR